jgi:hypothetical protein
MRSPFIIFNLLTIHIVDDVYIQICDLEFEHGSGSLLSIGRTYNEKWEFDFLYYRLFKYWVLDWIERRD